MRLYFDNLTAKEYLSLLRKFRPQAEIHSKHSTKEPGYSNVEVGEKLNIYTGIVKADALKFRIMVLVKPFVF